MAHAAHDVLRHRARGPDLGVGEAVTLGQSQQLRGEHGCGAHLLADLVEQGDLVEEPRVDRGRGMHLVDRGAGPKQCLDLLETAVVRDADRLEQGLAVDVARAHPPS